MFGKKIIYFLMSFVILQLNATEIDPQKEALRKKMLTVFTAAKYVEQKEYLNAVKLYSELKYEGQKYSFLADEDYCHNHKLALFYENGLHHINQNPDIKKASENYNMAYQFYLKNAALKIQNLQTNDPFSSKIPLLKLASLNKVGKGTEKNDYKFEKFTKMASSQNVIHSNHKLGFINEELAVYFKIHKNMEMSSKYFNCALQSYALSLENSELPSLLPYCRVLNELNVTDKMDILSNYVDKLMKLEKIALLLKMYLYENGLGFEKNEEKAREYETVYKKKFKEDGDFPYYMLGFAFERGKFDHIPNYSEAFKLFQKSGDHKSLNAIGCLYENGQGVPQNYEKAIEFYEKAGKAGNVNALNNHAALLLQHETDTLYDPKKIINLFQQAHQKGHDTAIVNLGIFYSETLYGNDPIQNAISCFEIGVKKGNTVAMKNLAQIYHFGTDKIKVNYKKAFELCKMLIEKGDYSCATNLGTLYLKGQGTAQNFEKAFELFNRGLKTSKSVNAVNNLALMYYRGYHVKKDAKKALELLESVSNKNNLGHVKFQVHNFHAEFSKDLTGSVPYWK